MRTIEAEAKPRKSRRPSWAAPQSQHDPEGDYRKFRKARFAHVRAMAKLANELDPGAFAGLDPCEFLRRIRVSLTEGEPLTKDEIEACCTPEDARLYREYYGYLYEHSRRIQPDALYEAEVILDLYKHKASDERHFVIGVDFCLGREKDRFRAVMYSAKGSWYSGVEKDIPAGMR